MKYALPERLPRAGRVREIAFGGDSDEASEWLLLDSHVWYWALFGQLDRLPVAARAAVTHAVEHRRVAISDATPWELLVKASAGRLPVTGDARAWIETALGRSGAHAIPLRRDILLDAATLPPDAPGDPFDRVIMATARRERMSLVTADRAILQWAAASGAIRTVGTDAR